MRALRKDDDWREVAKVRADSKNRISLGRKVKLAARRFRLYQHRVSGRILLEPMAIIPLSEPWLDRSPEGRASLERGLADAKAGRLVNVPEYLSKYTDPK
jgi:predicted transcriptional regulator